MGLERSGDSGLSRPTIHLPKLWENIPNLNGRDCDVHIQFQQLRSSKAIVSRGRRWISPYCTQNYAARWSYNNRWWMHTNETDRYEMMIMKLMIWGNVMKSANLMRGKVLPATYPNTNSRSFAFCCSEYFWFDTHRHPQSWSLRLPRLGRTGLCAGLGQPYASAPDLMLASWKTRSGTSLCVNKHADNLSGLTFATRTFVSGGAAFSIFFFFSLYYQ